MASKNAQYSMFGYVSYRHSVPGTFIVYCAKVKDYPIVVCMVVCFARVNKAVMSIPPLLSSTPPPLEENGSLHEHEDDFGDFSDHASVGAVDSTTSITDSSSVFRPIETPTLPGSVYQTDANLKPDGFQEADEWSEFDSSVVEPSYECMHTDSTDVFSDEKLVIDGSLSDGVCVGTPRDCVSNEGSTDELSSVSPSTSQAIISEQLNLGDVSSSSFIDADVKHSDENLHREEHTVGKCDHELCDNVNIVSEYSYPQCEVAEVEHHVDEDELPCYAGDNQDLEFHSSDDLAELENDNEDSNGFHISSTVAVSDADEHASANDNQSASDEDDIVDDFQSFTDHLETPQDSVLVEEEPSIMHNNEDSAFKSCKEQEVSVCVETRAVTELVSANSASVGTTCNTDLSSTVTSDSSTTAGDDEIASANQQLTHEQMFASTEEATDDFDDFEEFVAAKEGLAEHQPVVDSGTYHWNAFENADADDDDWAAFQDSDQPVSTVSGSEVSDSNVAFIQQPVMAFSGQLSKARNF